MLCTIEQQFPFLRKTVPQTKKVLILKGKFILYYAPRSNSLMFLEVKEKMSPDFDDLLYHFQLSDAY